MRRFYLLGVAAACCPLLAIAQDTTCTTIGNVTNCHQQGSNQPFDYSGALNRAQRLVPSYAEREGAIQQAEGARLQNMNTRDRIACRAKAMRAIDDGEYEKAKALAALCPSP